MAGVKTLQAAIEAILFTMGESVELSKIAKAIEQDEQTTEELLQDLMKKYESKNRGIRIIELDKSYQMCTKKEMYDYLIRVAKQPKKYTLTHCQMLCWKPYPSLHTNSRSLRSR